MADKSNWIESHERSVIGMAMLANAQEWIDCLSEQKNGVFIRLFLPDKVKSSFDAAAKSITAKGDDATVFESTIFTLLILDGISKVVGERGDELKLEILGDVLEGMIDERKSSDQDQSSDQEADENPLSGS